MKFIRFELESATGAGVVEGGQIYVIPSETTLESLIEAGEDALKRAGRQAIEAEMTIPLDIVSILSPLATPPTFRDFYAFEQHVKAGRGSRGLEMDPYWYEIPVFYFSNPYAFRGCGHIPMTPDTEKFDFELEIAAVVGRTGSNLTVEEAEESIMGYCILNDWSGRDVQQREMTLSLGPTKGKDTSTSLGPYLVTKEELADHRTGKGFDRQMTLSVNGRTYSRANWSEVYWSFAEMISYASRGTEVRPGDVIGSGTCGSGCILELSQTFGEREYPWLKPGDKVVATVEGLGSLTNTVTPADPLVTLRL